MKSKRLFIIIAILFIFSFIGCSEGYSGEYYTTENYNQANVIDEFANEVILDRKIIYTADMTFDVLDLDDASDTLKQMVADDEWFEKEVISSRTHTYVVRVKTDRLDSFIESLKDEFVVRSYKKEATDISLRYQDTTNQILALEAQLARLIELYAEASVSDMILINEQISDIEVELQELNGELTQFDSWIDYSVVNISFYGETVLTESPFINRIGNAFVNGFNALINFIDGVLIVIATIIPFALLIGGIGGVVLLVYKQRRKHLKQSSEKES